MAALWLERMKSEKTTLYTNYTKKRYANLYNWIVLFIFAAINDKKQQYA